LPGSAPPELSDQELLRRYARTQDQQAFATIVSRYSKMVTGIARRASISSADAEDVCQAVFLLLSNSIHTVAWKHSISNWLYATTRHIASKVHRQNQRRSRREASVSPRESVSPLNEMKVRELFVILDEEMEKLPPRYRETILLTYFEDASRQEVADRLGIPAATVKTRLERARQRLARALAQRGVTVCISSIFLCCATATAAPTTRLETILSAVSGTASLRARQLAQGVHMFGIGTTFRATVMALAILVGGSMSMMAQSKTGPMSLTVSLEPVMPRIEHEPPDPVPQVESDVKTAAYSRDGRYLAVSMMRLEKTSDGKLITSTRTPNPGRDPSITLYDTKTWKPLHQLKTEQTTTSLCFSADGETLYSAEMDDKVYEWKVSTGMKAKTLEINKGKCEKLVMIPNGKMLLIAHLNQLSVKMPDNTFVHDQSANCISFWDIAGEKVIRTFVYEQGALLPGSITVSPDGSVLAASYHASQTISANVDGFHGIIEWDINTGKELRRYDAPRSSKEAFPVVHAIAFTLDGKGIILAGGEVLPRGNGQQAVGKIWLFDRKTGKLEKTIGDDRKGLIRSMVLSADGSRLYLPAGWSDLATEKTINQFSPEIQCWDTATWKLHWVRRDPQATTHAHLAHSPQSQRLSFAGEHGLQFLDTRDGKTRGGLVKPVK
jgi:RNA polymerase sigma factor (sigma-70 family)